MTVFAQLLSVPVEASFSDDLHARHQTSSHPNYQLSTPREIPPVLELYFAYSPLHPTYFKRPSILSSHVNKMSEAAHCP